MALALAVTGSWQIATIADFARAIFQRIPALFG
jgi:flagellar biosynthesis protein FliQ